ncbi:MAG TPA: hypothetical protein VGU68_05645 [Ktedonobacteraceae bacterium]|nr:hypothetical protein [Ktedonobacteraceae bacterium]
MFFNDPLEGIETVENSSLAASIVPVFKNITTGKRFQWGFFLSFVLRVREEAPMSIGQRI